MLVCLTSQTNASIAGAQYATRAWRQAPFASYLGLCSGHIVDTQWTRSEHTMDTTVDTQWTLQNTRFRVVKEENFTFLRRPLPYRLLKSCILQCPLLCPLCVHCVPTVCPLCVHCEVQARLEGAAPDNCAGSRLLPIGWRISMLCTYSMDSLLLGARPTWDFGQQPGTVARLRPRRCRHIRDFETFELSIES